MRLLHHGDLTGGSHPKHTKTLPSAIGEQGVLQGGIKFVVCVDGDGYPLFVRRIALPGELVGCGRYGRAERGAEHWERD